MSDEAVIQRINRISEDELGRVYGVRMRISGATVECNLYRTTKENAMACYRALKAIVPPERYHWFEGAGALDVEIMMFESH